MCLTISSANVLILHRTFNKFNLKDDANTDMIIFRQIKEKINILQTETLRFYHKFIKIKKQVFKYLLTTWIFNWVNYFLTSSIHSLIINEHDFILF